MSDVFGNHRRDYDPKLGKVCIHGSLQRSCTICELEAENKRMREVLQWVVDEYERGERKGYDAKITPEIAASAISQIGDKGE